MFVFDSVFQTRGLRFGTATTGWSQSVVEAMWPSVALNSKTTE